MAVVRETRLPRSLGEVGVDAGDEPLVGEVAVRAERERAQQEVAQRVRAVALGQQIRVYDVALGLRHLAAVQQQPAVTIDVFSAAAGRAPLG